jgi:hypothetical protein
VGGGRRAADTAIDDPGVLLQEKRVGRLGLDRDHPVA